jgi:hypothetical protein
VDTRHQAAKLTGAAQETMLPIPELSDLEVAFPAKAPIPPWDELPKEFRDNWDDNAWCDIAAKFFYKGGSLDEFKLTPKEGVDVKKAIRAIKAALGSFEPSHEHKMAAVGYMLSQWFNRAESK